MMTIYFRNLMVLLREKRSEGATEFEAYTK
jgi:hypothetical protein